MSTKRSPVKLRSWFLTFLALYMMSAALSAQTPFPCPCFNCVLDQCVLRGTTASGYPDCTHKCYPGVKQALFSHDLSLPGFLTEQKGGALIVSSVIDPLLSGTIFAGDEVVSINGRPAVSSSCVAKPWDTDQSGTDQRKSAQVELRRNGKLLAIAVSLKPVSAYLAPRWKVGSMSQEQQKMQGDPTNENGNKARSFVLACEASNSQVKCR